MSNGYYQNYNILLKVTIAFNMVDQFTDYRTQKRSDIHVRKRKPAPTN